MSNDPEEHKVSESKVEVNGQATQHYLLIEGLTTITKEIRELKKEMKEDLSRFKE